MAPVLNPRSKLPASERSHALCRWFARLLGCDTTRITQPGDELFLIIGHRRNTRDDAGTWIDAQGNRKDWDYTQEAVVASGRTVRELIAAARHYQRLSGMTMLDYLREKFPGNPLLVKRTPEVNQYPLSADEALPS